MNLGTVLCLPIVLASMGIAKQNPSEAQNQKNIEICTQNLLAIGKAVQAYHNDHGDFPEWLSELYPKYLQDANLLLCPADKGGGKAIAAFNADPKMSVSYGYQFHPEYREGTQKNRTVYGDVIPLARCRHHANQPFDCLNLSFSFKVFRSSEIWQSTPEDMYGTPEKAITALEAGLQRQTNSGRLSDHVHSALTRLYIEVGREKDADNTIDRFKSIMDPNDARNCFALAEMLERVKRDEEALPVFEKLAGQYPDDYLVLNKLAEIHWKVGNSKLAKEYHLKVAPDSELVGKLVPDFSAIDLDGKPISLQQYRGKVVLLDFWAVWCGFCLREMPNVKKVYDTYNDKGFDVIGVSLDDDEAELMDYLKENSIPWRQIFTGQGMESPLALQYNIAGPPAPWLIDRDGTLISSDARGAALGYLVEEAIKDKSENK
jgi:peroxiredoxin